MAVPLIYSSKMVFLPLLLLLLGSAPIIVVEGTAAAFVVVAPDRRRLVDRPTTTFEQQHSSSALSLSDGNPPPFGDWGAAAPVAPPAAASVAPAPAPAYTAPAAAVGSSSSDNDDVVATLQASQDALLQTIQAAIPDLTAKPMELAWTPAAGETTPTLQAFDAPGAANVAWLASVCVPRRMSSLTIFNGPLTDVPHILSRCCLVDDNNMLELAVDLRPRAYGAYELQDPVTGEYPGPEQLGRKAFEYSGARKDFLEKFGTPALAQVLRAD